MAVSRSQGFTSLTPPTTLQDFAPRRVTLNGAPCQLLFRTARPVPVSIDDDGAFTYQPFVDATGGAAPVTTEALEPPLLPGLTRARAEAEQPVSIKDGQLIGVDGKPLALQGIAWCAAPAKTWRLKGLQMWGSAAAHPRLRPSCAGGWVAFAALCRMQTCNVFHGLQLWASFGVRQAPFCHQCCMRRYGFETNTNMVHGLYGPNAVVEDFLTVMYRIKALGFNAIRTPVSFLVRSEARSSYVGPVRSGCASLS